MQIHRKTQHNTTVWISDHVLSSFDENWFDYPCSNPELSATNWKSGRSPVSKLTNNGRNLICRHYFRGGLPARLTRDKFIFCGLENCRSYRELELLLLMRELNLPVPEPIAARCIVQGLVYSADIIITEIPHAETLAQVLAGRSLSSSEWQKIGNIIYQFHINDIQHVDLNANNILIDKNGEIFLIDFDRCSRKKYSEQWAKSNLNRLKRSLMKFKSADPSFNFIDDNFSQLIMGYQN